MPSLLSPYNLSQQTRLNNGCIRKAAMSQFAQNYPQIVIFDLVSSSCIHEDMAFSVSYTVGLVSMTMALSLAATQKACYFPNGVRAPDSWTPCDATAEVSHCCLDTHLCLDNKYCYSQDDGSRRQPFTNRIWRGACTYENWKSPQCPDHCDDCKFVIFAFLLLNPIARLP